MKQALASNICATPVPEQKRPRCDSSRKEFHIYATAAANFFFGIARVRRWLELFLFLGQAPAWYPTLKIEATTFEQTPLATTPHTVRGVERRCTCGLFCTSCAFCGSIALYFLGVSHAKIEWNRAFEKPGCN